MALEDLFDGLADFETPNYVKDGAEGTRIQDYTMVGQGMPMQATPTGPFQEIYESETGGMVRGWEITILDPSFNLYHSFRVTLRGSGYNGNRIIVNSFERYNNPGSTIPIYVVFQGEEYIGTGDDA